MEIAQIVRFLPGVNFLIDLSVSQSVKLKSINRLLPLAIQAFPKCPSGYGGGWRLFLIKYFSNHLIFTQNFAQFS